MLVQEIHLFLTRQFLVAGQGDDLHTRSHHEESHVETDLVVTSACASVGDGISANLLGITGDGNGLEDTLTADGDRITIVTQHIAKDHVFQRLGVILLRHVEGHILNGSQFIGVLFVGLQLLGAESAGIGAGGIDIPTVLG